MSQYKVGFVSLGCPKNLVDTEVMLRKLSDKGYIITPDETEADVVVINTCAFIDSAKKEAIDNILDIAWLKENKSLKGIVVCGCLAERYGEEIMKEMPEVDAVVGVGSMSDISAAVEKALKGEKYFSAKDKNLSPLGGDRIVTTPDYAAYIKIAEGCDNRCTYCAIPYIRGRFRSRPMEDIIKEAKELEAIGVKELCVVAQDTTRYGLDIYGGYSLARLLREITAATQIPWIRVLYCYPDKITDELIEEFKNSERIVKYIDLPIQHVSENILLRMNRRGGRDAVLSAIKRLREGVPGITIRTTAIVGFPGETEEDFEELCSFIKEAKFDRFGAFAYSREEGTPAYDFPDQVDEQTKEDRYSVIMQTQADISEALNELKKGTLVTVLTEGYDPVSSAYYGRSAADAPDIDGKVYFNSRRKIKEGTFVNVRITDVLDYDLFGTEERS